MSSFLWGVFVGFLVFVVAPIIIGWMGPRRMRAAIVKGLNKLCDRMLTRLERQMEISSNGES